METTRAFACGFGRPHPRPSREPFFLCTETIHDPACETARARMRLISRFAKRPYVKTYHARLVWSSTDIPVSRYVQCMAQIPALGCDAEAGRPLEEVIRWDRARSAGPSVKRPYYSSSAASRPKSTP